MDLPWLFFGRMPLDKRIARLARARDMVAARLAEAEFTVEGLRVDLQRIDNAPDDFLAVSYMLGDKHGG